MGRKESRDGPKWPAPAKLRADRAQACERAETDLMAGTCQNKGRVGEGKNGRKEGRDGPCQLRNGSER